MAPCEMRLGPLMRLLSFLAYYTLVATATPISTGTDVLCQEGVRICGHQILERDPESVFDLRLSAARLVDQRGLAQLSVVDGLIPEVLFECASTWWSGYERPHFVAMNYCVDGCKSAGSLGSEESASCAADLSRGFRAWGESNPDPEPQAELR